MKQNQIHSDINVGVMCFMIPHYHIFLVVNGNKVNIWNSLTGDVKKIFSNLCSSEITALCIDELGKRFAIGNLEGFLGVYNIFNGALLKSIKDKKAEIKHVFFSRVSQVMCSVDASNTLNCPDGTWSMLTND